VNRYKLPISERRRFHRQAFRRQQLDHGEVCGLLTVDLDSSIRLIFIKNVCERPGGYAMTVRDIRQGKERARDNGTRVVGFFHSHPVSPPVLSRRDVAQSPARSLQLVYDVCGRELRLYAVTRSRSHTVITEVPLIVDRGGHSDGVNRTKRRKRAHSTRAHEGLRRSTVSE
jgi:proteasome lid subunit RPN8/RPN11